MALDHDREINRLHPLAHLAAIGPMASPNRPPQYKKQLYYRLGYIPLAGFAFISKALDFQLFFVILRLWIRSVKVIFSYGGLFFPNLGAALFIEWLY